MEKLLFNHRYVYATGDIHGNFETLVSYINRHELTDSIIIVAGDCGVGFHAKGYYTTLFEKLDRRLADINSTVLLMRGNHDDPAYFNDEPLIYDHIRTIKDYTIVSINKYGEEYNILCVGGAISIDRHLRKKDDAVFNHRRTENRKRYSYWYNEGFNLDLPTLNNISENNNIHCVVTHANPFYNGGILSNYVMSYANHDETLIEDIKHEHTLMENMLDVLSKCNNIRLWVNGHYHDYSTFYVQSNDNIVKCKTLINIERKFDVVDIVVDE